VNDVMIAFFWLAYHYANQIPHGDESISFDFWHCGHLDFCEAEFFFGEYRPGKSVFHYSADYKKIESMVNSIERC